MKKLLSTLLLFLLFLLQLKRSHQILLGAKKRLTREEIHSEEFVKILSQAVDECNREHKSDYWHRQETVSDATKQIVQGTNYEFNVRLRQTSCPKEAALSGQLNKTDGECIVQHGMPHIICSATVLYRPWLQDKVKVTVRGTWRVSSKVFSINEIHTSLGAEAMLAKTFQDAISKAVDRYNLQNHFPNLMKYSGLAEHLRQSEKPGTLITEIVMDESTCTRPNSIEEIEKLKKDPCYAANTGDTQMCELHLTESLDNATIVNCEEQNVEQRGLWRSTGPQLSSANPESIPKPPRILENSKPQMGQKTPQWEKKPVKLALLSVTKEVPPEELESGEYPALFRQLVDTYNRQSNALFMYTLQSVKQVKVEEEPPKTFGIKLRLQETKCMKNQGYLDDATKFDNDCTKLDPLQRIVECTMSATETKNPDKPYKIQLERCQHLSPMLHLKLGGKAPMDLVQQKSEEFKELLKRVAEQFNSNPKSTMIYTVDRVENVATQVISGEKIFMDVMFKAVACKLMEAKESCHGENEQHMFKCNVVVIQGHSGDPKEEINITNCWRLVEKSTPVHGKWIKLSDQMLRSEELSDLYNRAVSVYNQMENGKQTPLELNYVADVKKQTGSQELLVFKLYLKGEEKTKQKVCQVTMLSPYTVNDKISVSNCVDHKEPKILLGAPRSISETEFEDQSYAEMLVKATGKFNQQSDSQFYHRLHHAENPTVQLVAGSLTRFTIHLQPTSCIKGENDKHIAANEHHLCGPINVTHAVICNASVWQKQWQNFEEIKVEDCQLRRNRIPAWGMVKMGKDNHLLTKSHFRRILDRAVSVYNTQTRNKVFYEQQTVENITQMLDNGYKFTFELGLKPTNCLREEDFVPFVEKRYQNCHGTIEQHAVHCKISAWSKDSPRGEEEFTVDSCLWIYPTTEMKNETAKRLSATELIKPEFKMLEELAAGLFNRSVDSPVTYKVYTVENAVTHPYPGNLITFDMYLQPATCRSLSSEDRTQMINETKCNLTVPLYFVSCHVKTWQRPWIHESTLISIDNCHVIQNNESILYLGALGQLDKRGVNMTYVNELAPRLTMMFNRMANESYEYVKQKIENVAQQIVAGQKITFDLYLKPIPGSFNSSMCNGTDEVCPSENHFYLCKASVWTRPWLNSEVLNLDKCMLVETPIDSPLVGAPQPLEVKKPNPKLNDIKERAIKLYNEKLATDFLFGNGEITDATEQVVGGLQTKFNLQMKPIACKLNANRKACDATQSRIRVQCQVVFLERPWMEESERIAVENCRRFFDDGTVANHEVRLSQEEEQSAEFQLILKQMAGLYKQKMPIVYSVDKILNARVKHDKVRNITFNIILKPSGCNSSEPLSNEPECINWAEQDQVSCEGLISEHPDGYRTMSIRNCRVLWKAQAERALTAAEQQTKWFRQSVRDAIKLYQSSTSSQNLFKLRSVESGTLKRSDIEVVKYKMILAETHCVKGEDEDKIWEDDECPEKKPEVLQTCAVELKRQPDRSHDLSISC